MDKSTRVAVATTTTIALVVEQGVCSRPLVGVVVQPMALGVASAHVENVTFIHIVETRKTTKQLVHVGNARGALDRIIHNLCLILLYTKRFYRDNHKTGNAMEFKRLFKRLFKGPWAGAIHSFTDIPPIYRYVTHLPITIKRGL